MSNQPADADTDATHRVAVLMARYCDGEAAAFGELYGWLAPRILAYLKTLAKDQAAAEDLLQVTFLKLHLARAAYVRGANPLPWVYVIARRSCLDELRRRKRGRVWLKSAGREWGDATADLTGAVASAQPREHHEGSEPARAMAALSGLPARQREALLLTKVQGRTLVETAALTGSTVGAVKQRVHRACSTLRQRVAAHRPVAFIRRPQAG